MELSFDQQTWEQALTSLRGNVDEESFSTWIRPAKLLGLQGNTVTLGVPSSFYKNWLMANYREAIIRALREATACDLDISCCVIQAEQSETGTAPAAAPVMGPLAPPRPAPQPMAHPVHPAVPQAPASSTIEFPRSTYLNPKYTFDQYVVGESNRFAHAACRQVADPVSKSYNPLFLYGGVGLGKTHLMHAIGHQIVTINPQLRVLYVTSEQFMNSFIETISQGKQTEFRDYYRTVDLLMIDDVQFFAGKERTQTEFFHTFNALYDAGKKIVVSSDRSPKELTTLEDRLRNRFSWGLVVDIQPPDLETRIAILKKKAIADGTELPNDVLVYIAERIRSNIRELEGVFVRLKAYSLLHKEPITLQLAKNVLVHLLDEDTPSDIDIEEIIEAVCDYFELKRSDLLGTSRLKKFSSPRHIAQYLARSLTSLSYPEIAQRFGGRDHTSILHAVRKIEEEVDRDQNLKNLVSYLTKKLRGSHASL